MTKITAAITGVGGYVPDFVLSNSLLEQMVDTTGEWITTRTGIKERRILKEEGKGASFLGKKAVEDLFRKTGTNPADIDLVIFASVTPDMPVAISGAYLATEIGAVNAFAIDLQAACSSFLYGMSVAARYIESGRYKKVLLVGADKMSSIIDYTDRATCIIFGDGAGAVLFEPNYEGLGVQDEYLRSDGTGREYLKYAVSRMADATDIILERNHLNAENLNWLVPHQANKRIIDATADRMGLTHDKVMINIQHYGNTSSATLPLALYDYEKQLRKGDNIIFVAFGGGFTWGALYLKWAYNPIQ